jgi:hypothetical protein
VEVLIEQLEIYKKNNPVGLNFKYNGERESCLCLVGR